MAPNESYSQHVVTAVIVAHDGAAWLAHGIDALQEQTRPVQRVVAVDTGSRDRSGSVLASKLGQAAVFGMDRSTGYAAAVRRALQHKAASTPVPGPASGAARSRSGPMEWIWLLHDDCEPAPDALEQLLRGAAETPTAAVLGPKLRDWRDRAVILEAGLSLDTVGRRITGIEPREVDQGQHDGDHDVLAVSSAGMLVRRDVWDQVGGFDPGMTLFGEDVDFCWRVHAAGFRVRVITDAVVYHALAATRGRRPISVGRRARLLDRRHGLQTLLGNLPAGPMLGSLVSNLMISLVRTVFYTMAKRGTAALDEAAAVLGVVGYPLRFARTRRRRASGRRAAYGRVRADLLPGRSIRRMAEFLALVLSRSGTAGPAAAHSAIDDPTEDDSLLIDSGFLQRFITRPGVLLVLGLIVVTAIAEHRLIGGGPLGGGALTPAWEGASQLWQQVLAAFHPTGIGSASAAPPYAGFVALLATILLGKVWLAVDVLLLGSVPMAGVTAVLALRRVTRSASVRVWAAASYALLPVAFGAIAAGRLGSAVAFVLIPVIGLLAGRMFTETPRLARRAAWATGLVLAVGTAFVPILWPMAVVAAAVAAVAMRRRGRGRLVDLAITALTPLALLLPWMLEQLAHPASLLLEAGVQQPGLSTPALPARSVLLLSPGGPGLPPFWVSAAVVLAGLAALLATRQRALIMAGWCIALLGFGTAVAVSGLTVTPPGGAAVIPWPGPAIAIAAAGLLVAAAAGGDGLVRSLSGRTRKGRKRSATRGAGVALIGLAAVSAPALAAGFWLVHGVSGPIGPATSQIIPALVPVSGGSGRQLRTLVLSSDHGRISYLLLRTDSPQFADAGVVPVPAAQAALGRAVAALLAPNGGQAADQSELLAHFDIGFVLLRAPVSAQLVSQLDAVSGLTGVSMTSAFDLWRLGDTPSRVSVVEPSGAVVPISSGPVGMAGAPAPAAGGILELAEPAGGWDASLNGRALRSVTSPAGSWAQAFRLPPGGGTISISRAGLMHDLITALELLAFLVVAVLALPGVRTAAELEADAAASAQRVGDEDVEAADPAEAESGAPARAGRGRARAGKRQGRTGRRGARPQPDAAPAAPTPSRRAGVGRLARGAAAGAGRADQVRADRVRADRVQADRGLAGTTLSGARAPDAGLTDSELTSAGASAGGLPRVGRPGSGAESPAQAAWPAGQPASRFMGGPPPSMPGLSPSGSRFEDEPTGADQAPGRPRHAPGTARRDLSPSGTRFDPSGTGVDAVGTRFDAAAPDDRAYSPSRPDEHAGQPAPQAEDTRRRRGLRPSRKRADDRRGRRRHASSDGDHESAALGTPAGPPQFSQPAGSRSPSGSPYDDEPGYRDQGWRYANDLPDDAPASDRGRERMPPLAASGWPASPPSSWQPEDDAPGWPERGEQHGWQQEYQAPEGSGWPAPGRDAWPERAEALEALPPLDEVHHDWPRSDRSRRGWIAPDDETDGGTW